MSESFSDRMQREIRERAQQARAAFVGSVIMRISDMIEQLEPADGTPFGEGLIGRIYDYVHGPGEYQRQIQQGETADEQLTPFERSLQQRMQDYANQK